MTLTREPARLEALGDWIARRLGLPAVRVTDARVLPGGAIQENWLITCGLGSGSQAAERRFVLRRNAAATIASSRPLGQEFALLSAAHAAGVLVPQPIGFCDDPGVLGHRFSLVAAVEGVGLGPRIVKDCGLGGDRCELAARLGRELAKVHAIRPPQPALDFLGVPSADPALATVAGLRETLDRLGGPKPGPGVGAALGRAACACLPTGLSGARRLPHRQLSGRRCWSCRDPRLGVRWLGRSDGRSRLVLRRVLALRPC